MPVINEKVVISKYIKAQRIIANIYDLKERCKIIDVISHTEKLLNLTFTAFADFIEIKALLGIYFIYYREGTAKREPCAFFTEETAIIRVNREDLTPQPKEFDFSSREFVVNIRGIKAKYDIDMDCRCVSAEITAEVIANLVEEKTIILRENSEEIREEEVEEFEEIPLSSVALSKNYFGGDLKNYAITLEELSKAINHKLVEIEEEKRGLRKEIERMQEEIREKDKQYVSLTERLNNILRDYTRQMDKLKNTETKYFREQKKAQLLEQENNKRLEEINQLSREKNDMLSNIEDRKSTIKNRIKQLLNIKHG